MTRSCNAVLFDLGNTLAAYYRAEQFDAILARCVRGVLLELQQRGLKCPGFDAALAAARAANTEAADFRFAPLQQRLVRVFELQGSSETLLDAVCRRFLEPIFAAGRLYEDSLPVLTSLRAMRYATAVVSNTPWGSPPALWRGELERMGLARAVSAVVFCGDVGWRKPARQVFLHAAERLGARCEDCIFVGDDLRWDVEGSEAAGMRPILIDRENRHPHYRGARISTLQELLALLSM